MWLSNILNYFFSLQKIRADDLKRVEDGIASLNQRIEAAEKLVEEGNKLSKLFVPKMNQVLFLQGQQKIGLDQKRKLELKSKIASENKKKKEPSTMKWSFILFFVLFVILNINDAQILTFQFIFHVFFPFQLVSTSSTGRLSLSHFIKCVYLKPKSKCISCF